MALRSINGERRNAAIRAASMEVKFSEAVPFDGRKRMAQTTITGALAFTVNTTGAIDGGTAQVDLIANGTNAPTFSGDFHEWGGSMGFDNRAGIRNILTMWRLGTNYVYSWAQFVGATAEPTPATAITLSGPSFGVVGVESANFTIGANGELAAPRVCTPSDAGDGGTFTPSTVTISGASPTATVTYTSASLGAKTISVTNDGGLDNPPSHPYTSNAEGSAQGVLRLTTLANLTETGDGTAGWNYRVNSNWASTYGVSTLKISAGSNGSVQGTLANTPRSQFAVALALSSSSTNASYLSFTYGAQAWTEYGRINSGAFVSIAGPIATAAGDILRITKTGTTIVADKSSNGGSSWTTLATWTGVPDVDYWVKVGGEDATADANYAVLANLRHSGMV